MSRVTCSEPNTARYAVSAEMRPLTQTTAVIFVGAAVVFGRQQLAATFARDAMCRPKPHSGVNVIDGPSSGSTSSAAAKAWCASSQRRAR
jgi:hypothetical protein